MEKITGVPEMANSEDSAFMPLKEKEVMMDCILGGAKIKVLGIGGGGGNAINSMINAGLQGVEFIAANTDFQALNQNLAPVKIQLGTTLTRGLGAGGNPEVGAKATEEDREKILEVIQGSDMVFIAGGLGGGTGTGGSPIAAQLCKDAGVLTVAVVTRPFQFEGKVRHRRAEEGLKALHGAVDTLIVIPNDRLASMADKRATLLDMFKRADDVLLDAVRGISDIIVKPGYINLDFTDVRSAMNERGLAMMGTGVARGENRAALAAQQAISSPLLEDISIHGAKAALINICADRDLMMYEFQEAATIIQKEVDEEAEIFIGTTIDPNIGDELRVTVIATGIGKLEIPRQVETTSGSRMRRFKEGVVPDLVSEDYLKIPAIVRNRPSRDRDGGSTGEEQPSTGKKRTFLSRLANLAPDEEDLSIPTFIRRQAD
jgi:cell division protein FtsZ